MECRVWSEERGVRSANWKAWGVKCKVWGVECFVSSVTCGV